MRQFSFKQPSHIVAVIVLSGTIIIFAEETHETVTLNPAPHFRLADEPFRRQQAVEFPNVAARHASTSVQPPASGNTSV